MASADTRQRVAKMAKVEKMGPRVPSPDFCGSTRRTKSTARQQRPARQSRLDPLKDLIETAHENNNELSAEKLCEILIELYGMNLSVSTIKAFRRRLGWVTCGLEFMQMIRLINRGIMSRPLQEVNERFHDKSDRHL